MKNILLVCLALGYWNTLHAQTVPSPQQTDQIILDNNSNSKADPGDKIRYKVTIQNTGGGTATGTTLNAVPDPRTTLVGGSFRTSPLAFDDGPYACIGNVGIAVPDGASDLLANDFDDAPAGLTCTAGTFATTQGGSITIAANGSFSYNPPRGFEGTDTYVYTVNDGNAVAGVTATNTGTVTFTVSGMIWFINNNAGACAATCDGRMSNPYTSLTDFNTANALAGGLNPDNNENIFIYESSTAYTGGIVLRNGQKLFGQDATITLAAMTGLTPPMFSNALPVTNSANGTKATITNTTVNGNGITLSTNNTLRGFTVGNTATTGTGAGINGNGIGALTINEVSKNGTGQILTLNNGSVNASFIELSTTNTNQTAVVLSNLTAGSVTDVDGSGSSISGANGVFSITSGTTTNVALTFNGDVTHAGANPLLLVQNHGTGTVTFQNGTLSSTGGGINFTNSDGTYNFNGTTTLSGASRITIDGGSSGIFNFNSNTSVTNPTNIAFDLNGSNATVDYNGTLSSNTAFRLIDIASNTGGSASFDGNLTFTGNAIGIRVQQNTGGTYSFNGASKTITSGANNAVSLVTNAGAFINFTGGGLVLTTTSGTGFNATGGGTVTVQGTGNTITSTTGTALNVANTTIGASGLTFQSISSGAGSNNGIQLDNTGASGGLTVTGDGTNTSVGGNSSGGTIAGKSGTDGSTTSGIGIYLNNTRNVVLRRMTINGTNQNFGIRGSSVVNFTMEYCTIGGTNGNNDGADEGSVIFTELTGSATVTNCHISGAVEHNMSVINTSGSLNRITVTGTTFGSMNTSTGSDGLLLETLNSAVINSTITNNNFTFARGDHFQLAVNSSSTNDIVFTGNTISNTGVTAVGGGGGIRFVGGSNNATATTADDINAALTFNVSNNTLRDSDGAALAVNKLGGGGNFSGTIANNTIGVAGVNQSGSKAGSGIFVLCDGSSPSSYTANITGNTVRQYSNHGIFMQTGGSGIVGSASMHLNVTGNTVKEPSAAVSGGLAKNGIHLNCGTSPGDTYLVCLNLGGAGALANDITGSGQDCVPTPCGTGQDFRLRQRQSTTVRLPGYGGANNNDAAVVTFVQGNNDPISTPSGLASNTVPTGGGYVGGAACNTP